MAENKEIKGNFRFDLDSKRYHLVRIVTEDGVTGSIYLPKSTDGKPENIILASFIKD